jgi:hypothetical protein
MPNAADILEQLGRSAREAWPVAMLWHGVLAVGLVAVLFGARPRLRVAAEDPPGASTACSGVARRRTSVDAARIGLHWGAWTTPWSRMSTRRS